MVEVPSKVVTFTSCAVKPLILFSQVIVEVRDNLRGLGSGVKRSLDDVEGKSYIRAKTRERYGQATHVISGPQKFVAANTVEVEEKSAQNSVKNDGTSLAEESNDNQERTQSNKEEAVDIFAE